MTAAEVPAMGGLHTCTAKYREGSWQRLDLRDLKKLVYYQEIVLLGAFPAPSNCYSYSFPISRVPRLAHPK